VMCCGFGVWGAAAQRFKAAGFFLEALPRKIVKGRALREQLFLCTLARYLG
jgi:hypothetical protein